MDNQAQHDMVLEKTHDNGTEEWVCPVCNRHVIMQWPPNYKKIVVYPGDEYAIHSGSKGGLKLSAPEIKQTDDQILSDELKSLLDDVLSDLDFGD